MSRDIEQMRIDGDVEGLMGEAWRVRNPDACETEALAEATRAEASETLAAIADAFSEMGAAALPTLRERLADPAWRRTAALCMMYVGDPAFVEALQISQDNEAPLEAHWGALEVIYLYAFEHHERAAFVEIRRVAQESKHEPMRAAASEMDMRLDRQAWERIRSQGQDDAKAAKAADAPQPSPLLLDIVRGFAESVSAVQAAEFEFHRATMEEFLRHKGKLRRRSRRRIDGAFAMLAEEVIGMQVRWTQVVEGCHEESVLLDSLEGIDESFDFARSEYGGYLTAQSDEDVIRVASERGPGGVSI